MSRPIIGITAGIAGPSEAREFSRASNVLYCGADYVNRIAESGGVPVILSISDDREVIARMVEVLDGLMLTGGEDVDPAHYGQEALMPEMVVMAERDAFELELLKQFIPTEKPILAICRGHQVLNVALGGTLIQDIPTLNGTRHHFQSAPPPATTHHVEITAGCRVEKLLEAARVDVNSYHHQVIDAVAPSLKVVARSEEGFVEAVEHREHPFLIGVQWHPERLCVDGSPQRRLFENFVEACILSRHATV